MHRSFNGSAERIRQASQFLPGGVSSNFRLGISPTPLVFDHADGPFLYDIDGNRLIDYYLGMGPMILGHRPEECRRRRRAQLERGILFGGQSEIEFEAAELVCGMLPSAEKVRFSSSGSEAVQAALRLARAATGRGVDRQVRGPLPRLARQCAVERRAGRRPDGRRAGAGARSRARPGRTPTPASSSRCCRGTAPTSSRSACRAATSPP